LPTSLSPPPLRFSCALHHIQSNFYHVRYQASTAASARVTSAADGTTVSLRKRAARLVAYLVRSASLSRNNSLSRRFSSSGRLFITCTIFNLVRESLPITSW